ncbi:hypothetical protein TrLO_g3245 [Triparma laevis f. longispina]|uniref:Uncharacterized protein n=1 Tax=Triparma laevis f. longispina TaxID=1714387 RepID=A0A9W7A5Z6_9STRA|nr:hypothetical protein TrLO_g3245 [Triparma laevis f. longispina]
MTADKKFVAVENYGLSAISIIDMISDIIMVVQFTQAGRTGFSLATVSCLSLNIGFQSITAFVSFRKQSLYVQLCEQMYIFFLVKPAVDVWRVRNSESPSITGVGVFDAKLQMVVTQVFELLMEALPGRVILLTSIFTQSSETSIVSFLALLSSLSTAALISAAISVDYDIDVNKRIFSQTYIQ